MTERRKKAICFDEEGLAALKKFVADEALVKAKAHLEPSPETKQTFKLMEDKMSKLEVSVARLEEKHDAQTCVMQEVKNAVGDVKEMIGAHIKKEDELPRTIENTYVRKDAVKIVYVTITAICVVIFSLLTLVLQYFKHFIN